MNMQPDTEYAYDELFEQAVHEYLSEHPDFFNRHSSLLGTLNLPHASGRAISLVERQVSVLRQRDVKLEKQLKELIGVARTNDILVAKIHELSLQLLAATDLPSTVVVLEEGMRSGFDADHAVLVIFGDPDAFADIDGGRFLRVTSRDSELLGPFKTFLGGSSARCGQIRDSQKEYLFRHDANDVGSAALVPLGDSGIGFLAIGSTDADRFHPGMSTDFLNRLGTLVAGALKRF